MDHLSKSAFIFAICLSMLAGFIDAIGFLHLQGHFISFMSGNSTQLAVSLASMDIPAILMLGGIILLFIAGTISGVLVRHFLRSFRPSIALLVFITILLAAGAASYEMGWSLQAIAFMTLAMGAENAIFQRNGEVVVGLTYMTGTLVKMGQRIANAMIGGKRSAWIPYLLLWLGLICGGCTGAFMFYLMGLHSIWIGVFWSCGLTILAGATKAIPD
jgi:uncharacterized membrane protein YoaK (UPF0700 family)